ncbi:MAG: polysaccharide deacetylase [Nocardioides sp.]|nr:polysaccharide deacetylase [Nocardioides sp.]
MNEDVVELEHPGSLGASQRHGRFDYSPIVARPPLRWPGGARVAVWMVLNLEYFHFSETFPGSPDPGAVPDVPGYSLREYGNRVGVWRLMEILDRHQIRATAAVNSELCLHAPAIIEAGQARSWEWMGHGVSNSVRIPGRTASEQGAMIESTLTGISAATGVRPTGWLGPGLAETQETPDLLRQAGLTYVADWVNDDQPFPMTTAYGDLYSIPYTFELNDKLIFGSRGAPASELHDMIVDQFDVLHREGADSGRVMAIALHPYLTGQPFRSAHLDRALTHLRQRDDVWWATGSEIIEAYRRSTEMQEHE